MIESNMPELPEVENVCRNLSQIVGCNESTIGKWIFFSSKIRYKLPKRKLESCSGKKIISIKRRAKYILISLDELTIISHLGMTGSWRSESKNWQKRKHDHVAFQYSQDRYLVYEDARRFGFLEVLDNCRLENRFSELGPEPLAIGADLKNIAKELKKTSTPIKSAIMNQKYIVGVGNIYASESLFRAGIHPLKKCSEISIVKLSNLIMEIQNVLSEAIKKGGSTINNYRNGLDQAGNFQKDFFVYGRAGEACLKCKNIVKQVVLSGRSTFYCEKCQK